MEKLVCKKCGSEDWVLKCTKCGEWVCPFCVMLHDIEKKQKCPVCGKKGFKKYDLQIEDKPIDHSHLNLDDKRFYMK